MEASGKDNQQQDKLEYRGYLKGKTTRVLTGEGHAGWVTSMQVGEETLADGTTREFLISGSRDKSIMIWDIIERKETDEDETWGTARKVLKGKSLALTVQATPTLSVTSACLRTAATLSPPPGTALSASGI